ncbi:DNA-binding transcription factor yap1 [Chytriomyces hyalinus]|nr:DNA-binding transcription factor yap1 [Chytriomyces hyalinus]
MDTAQAADCAYPEPDDGSGDDSLDNANMNKRQKPGRKPATSVPLTKKQEQTRRAQRNFRERQLKYVQSLEAKTDELADIVEAERKEKGQLRDQIAQLEIALANAVAELRQISNHFQLQTDRCTSSVCAREKEFLAETVRDLKIELASVRPHSESGVRYVRMATSSPLQVSTKPHKDLNDTTEVHPTATSISSASSLASIQPAPVVSKDCGRTDNLPKAHHTSLAFPLICEEAPLSTSVKVQSATELYGPPQVEFARQMCKSIPSLSNCQAVDEMYSLFTIQASCTDTALLLQYHVKSVRAWYKVFDAVKDSPADRKSLLEVDEVFHLINKDHMNRFYSIASLAAAAGTKRRTTQMPPSQPSNQAASTVPSATLQKLRIELCAIMSLRESLPLIETLLDTFARPASVAFFENSAVVRQLERLCSSDDRARLLSALYGIRVADCATHDAAFEHALEALDALSLV